MGLDNNKSQISPEISPVNWCGHDWRVFANSKHSRVLVPVETVDEPGFALNATKISSIYAQTVEILSQNWPSLPSFVMEAAVFPDSTFRQDTKLPDWVPVSVAGCVRNGRQCYSHSIANSSPELFSQLPAHKQIGELHELGHTALDLSVGKQLPLCFNESLPEIFPRFVLGLQIKETDSTQYFVDTLPSCLIDPTALDQETDMFVLSGNKLANNPAYASATMFTFGVMLNLDPGNPNPNLNLAFAQILEILKNTPNEDIYPTLAKATGKPLDTPEGRHNLQLQAVNYVRKHYTQI